MSSNLREHFLLDPEITYLNHGSFGACPRPVFQDYQRWQRELERHPVDFLTRQIRGIFRHDMGVGGPLVEAREALADCVNAPPEDLAFTINATVALNTIARSLDLQPGDEVLTTGHEYGAIDATWTRVCEKAGASMVRQSIPLPVTTHDDFIEAFWEGVTAQTRVILMSHITSPTALTLPIEEICRRAREAGILTVIDGAHAIGQLPLDIAALDPDFYTSNCHKWLCAPKGSAFLYVHPEQQAALEPLVISWAWVNEQPFSLLHEAWGTRDLAPFLSIPAAIAFQEEHDWDAVRARCQAMVVEARRRLIEVVGLPPIAPENEDWFAQMASVVLPDSVDALDLWNRLHADYQIEVPVFQLDERNILRISVQGYNTPEDVDRLVMALEELL